MIFNLFLGLQMIAAKFSDHPAIVKQFDTNLANVLAMDRTALDAASNADNTGPDRPSFHRLPNPSPAPV